MDTVCHVITKLELGGAQEVALYIVSHLNRSRFRPVLLTGPGGILAQDAQALPGVTVSIIPALGRSIHLIADLVALLQLVRYFRQSRPTIVHTHSSKAGILGRWAAWLAGVPIVVHTIHGFGITPQQSWWVRRCFTFLEWITSWITTHWIAVSRADMASGIAWGLFHADAVSVVRPGIDPAPFQVSLGADERHALRRELGATPDNWLVGTVACLKPQKAPGDFMAVAKRVCEVIPHARFVLVGDGELRPQVEALIRQYGLEGQCVLAGWRRDIPKVMQALDAFLLTSHWEGLPRVLLEARVAGLPIVATKVGGAEEAVVEGVQGWLSHPGDIDGLSRRLCSLAQVWHPSSGPRQMGVDRLPKEFQLDEMVRQYESLYDALLACRKKNLIRQAA